MNEPVYGMLDWDVEYNSKINVVFVHASSTSTPDV